MLGPDELDESMIIITTTGPGAEWTGNETNVKFLVLPKAEI